MASISGVWQYEGGRDIPTATQLQRITSAQINRSAAQQHHHTANVAFAYTPDAPTSTTQPQPHRHTADLLVVFDGQLHNCADLAAALPDARSAQATSDAVWVAYAYQRWGLDCPAHLYGEFALAIWDAAQQRLLLARDHIGVRPLYYCLLPAGCAFASDVQALLAVAPSAAVDEVTVAAYLTLQQPDDAQRTFFEAVRRVEPGCVLCIDPQRVQQQRYWHTASVPRIPYKRSSEYIDALRQRLLDAVAARTQSARGVAAHISGGLDSSTLAILAANALAQRNQQLAMGYSWSPDPQIMPITEPEADERTRIHAISQRYGFPLYFAGLTPQQTLDFMQLDMSIYGKADLVWELDVLRHAQQRDIGVILSGWGGDQGVTQHAYGYLAQLFLQGRWGRLLRELRQLRAGNKRTWRSLIKQQVLKPLLPTRSRRGYSRFQAAKGRYARQAFTVGLTDQLQPIRLGVRPGIRTTQRLYLSSPLLLARLESWAAWGALYGVVHRYPLLDRAVLELVLNMPAGLFYRDGVGRYAYRQALRGLVPDALLQHTSKADPASFADVRGNTFHTWQRLAQEPDLLHAFLTPQAQRWILTDALKADIMHIPKSTESDSVRRWLSILHTLRLCIVAKHHLESA